MSNQTTQTRSGTVRGKAAAVVMVLRLSPYCQRGPVILAPPSPVSPGMTTLGSPRSPRTSSWVIPAETEGKPLFTVESHPVPPVARRRPNSRTNESGENLPRDRQDIPQGYLPDPIEFI